MLFTKDDLLRLLRGFNPWWSGRAPGLPDFRRSFQEDCGRHAGEGSAPARLLLSGPRGAGKTTALLQVAADLLAGACDPRRILYLDLAHPMLSGVPLPQTLRLHRDIVCPRGQPAVLLLDEMPCARDWAEAFGAAGRGGDRVVATQSARMIASSTAAGWTVRSAPAPTFGEFLTIHGLDPLRGAEAPDPVRAGDVDGRELGRLAAALLPLRAKFHAYLVAARLAGRDDGSAPTSRVTLLAEDRVDDTMRYDSAERPGQRNLDELRRLFAFLCLHSGDVFPVRRYARSVGLAASTVAGHLDVLESCFLVRRLAPFARDGVATLKPRCRVFVADATLRSEQLRRDEQSFADPDELHRAVTAAILHHVVESKDGVPARFRYRREPRQSGSLDLVVCEARHRTLYRFEHPSNESPVVRAELLTFCRREYVDRVFLVTTDPGDVSVSRPDGGDTEFVRIPAHVLAYALSHPARGGRSRFPPQPAVREPVLV